MHALITGGAGFLGSHLANRLRERQWSVRVLDDLSSGRSDHLVAGVDLHRGDVNDLPLLWSLLQGVDVVFHLAALVSLPASAHHPRACNTVNVGGTVTLLEACRDVGVRRIVLASSATVYGAQSRQPVHEGMPPMPLVPYAVSKVAAEAYLFNLARINGFEAVALRIFNAYGPRQAIPHAHAPVIPRVMQDILNHRTVVVFGDGGQTRDFVYVDDVVDALVAAAAAPEANQQVINIGSGIELSINDVVARVGGTVGHSPNVMHNLQVQGGVTRLVADISRARSLLEFEPKVDLPTGLRRLHDLDPAFTEVRAP